MNYSYPYMNMFPASVAAQTAGRGGLSGLLSNIFGRGFNWSSILTNTQRTLGIVNQAIPVIKQAGPVINNAKTMFKVMKEFSGSSGGSGLNKLFNSKSKDTKNENVNNSKADVNSVNKSVEKDQSIKENNNSGGPTFFI